MGRFGPTYVASWMNQIEPLTKWMTAFTADPLLESDPAIVELGGSVVRKSSTWDRTALNTLTMTSQLVLQGIEPGTTLVAIGAFDDEFGGELIFSDLIRDADGNPAPLEYPSGGTFVLPANEYVVGIDVATSMPL